MGNITYQYKSPTARQVDGWTCGYRALLAITNPDDQFQLGAVRTIKKGIVEAHKENEQRKNSQKPAAASNTSTNHLTEDILQKMAALLAQRCGLLNPLLSRQVDGLLGSEGTPSNEEWLKINQQLESSEQFKQILVWLKGKQRLLKDWGVTAFANFREFELDKRTKAENKSFCESYQSKITAFCERFHANNSSQIVHANQQPLLTEQGQVNDTRYWLQGDDINQWCTKYNHDHRSGHSSAHIATIGSPGSHLEDVFQEMKKIFNTSERDLQQREIRYFVVSNNKTKADLSQGSHWTLLTIEVDHTNNVSVTYTDSMHKSDKSRMKDYVTEAVNRAKKITSQSSTTDVVKYNPSGPTIFQPPKNPSKTPTMEVQTKPEDLEKFKSEFITSLRKQPHFETLKTIEDGVSFNYQYSESTPENSSDTSSTHSDDTDREVSDSGSDASSVTSETKTVGIIAKPTKQGETFSVAPSSQPQLAKPSDQMACLMQMVLEKHCLLEGKAALDLTIPEQFIDTPVTSKWIVEQIQSLNSRVGDKKLSDDLTITVNDTVMVENGEAKAKAFTATL